MDTFSFPARQHTKNGYQYSLMLVGNGESLKLNLFAVDVEVLLPWPAPTVDRDARVAGEASRKPIRDNGYRATDIRFHVLPGLADNGDPSSRGQFANFRFVTL